MKQFEKMNCNVFRMRKLWGERVSFKITKNLEIEISKPFCKVCHELELQTCEYWIKNVSVHEFIPEKIEEFDFGEGIEVEDELGVVV